VRARALGALRKRSVIADKRRGSGQARLVDRSARVNFVINRAPIGWLARAGDGFAERLDRGKRAQ
jgi:hypothetical protein